MVKIEHIRIATDDPEAIERAFFSSAPYAVACNNWAKEYPYAPQVSFRMFHHDNRLFLRYEVAEEYTQALITQDNGAVWTDSCVEFFIAPDQTGYYNFEISCIGQLLLAFRTEKSAPPIYAPATVMDTIVRYPSLGNQPFAEREGNNHWTLTLIIPASALFQHQIATWHGVQARMNLYKCGDGLSHPHFLSWQPIHTASPDFHTPPYFADVEFNK
ncbi:MAG: carbohydrate-binding family 9-like protein [Alistipes sp.]